MFRISQWEHENEEYYSQFGLPCHCGLDFPAVNGTPVKTVANGIVYHINLSPTASNYGIHVRVRHADGWVTIYCHLQSVNVVLNQVVQTGHTVGLSNNTGNSTGPHLHMELRNEQRSFTDNSGRIWPYGLHPVWPYIESLYKEWLDTVGREGYLYSPGLIRNMTGDYARVSGTLNLRAEPNSNSTLLGQVTTGTVVQILSAPVNNYCRVLTVVDIPIVASRADYGLHLRADPDTPTEAEFNVVRQLIASGGKTVKLLHNHPDNVYNRVNSYNPDYVVIRIMQSWGGRAITPQQFYEWNISELSRKIALLPGIDILIEVHNEPNLREEGWGYSWQNGAEFGQWLKQVVTLFSNALGGRVRFLYPGLSPGGYIPNVRYDSLAFLQESVSQNLNVNAYAVHAYWSNSYPLSAAVQSVQQARNIFGLNREVYVTEASRNDRPSVVSPEQYGREYVQFIEQVGADGVYFFVGSASNLYFEPETWVSVSGQDKGILTSFLANLA